MDRDEYRVIIRGNECVYPAGTILSEIAREHRGEYRHDIVLAIYRGRLFELHRELDADGEIDFLTTADRLGKNAYRRSVTFLMQVAVYHCFPEKRLLVLHSLGQGYYCEFREGKATLPVDEADIYKLRDEMRALVARDLPLLKYSLNTHEAIESLRRIGREDKARLLRYRRSSTVNIYELDGYMDYFYGAMVPSAGSLSYFELLPYQSGFMLMFPNEDPCAVSEFKPLDKLFSIMDESRRWGEELGVSNVGELNDCIVAGHAQDLILIQESMMEKKIGDIAERIAGDGRIKFVLVAGPTSSGKTTFSHRLSIQLMAKGLKPHAISLDDFYVNREDTPKDENGEYDFECLEAIDISLFNRCMGELLSGHESTLPVFNFKSGRREWRSCPLSMHADDVLVIEGIHGLNEKLSSDIPRENKFKIYISALTQIDIDDHNNLPTTDARLLRRIVRDERTRSTDSSRTLARWDMVRRGEEKNIFPFQEEADVMFNSALIYELSVLKLYAEPLLFSVQSGSPEYQEAKRLLKFLDYFLPIPGEQIGHNSILREFIGGSCFHV